MRLPLWVGFVASIWCFSAFPEATLKCTPDIFLGLWQAPVAAAAAAGRPDLSFTLPVPTTLSAAYSLGQLGSESLATTRLEKAGAILGMGRPLTMDEFARLPSRIDEVEANVGIISRLWGMLSLINLMLFLGGVGMAVFVLPMLSVIWEPLAVILLGLLDIALRFIMWLEPVHEPFSFVTVALWIIQGGRYSSQMGIYISLVGAVALTAVSWRSLCRVKKLGIDGRETVWSILMIGTWMPLAIFYQSQLFGWMTVGALYSAIGFSAFTTGLCFYIGFKDDNSLHRVSTTSLLILILTCALRIAVRSAILDAVMMQPFGGALSVLGAVTYLLARLIGSSRYTIVHWTRGNDSDYLYAQFLMIISLVVLLVVGHLWAISSLANTASTFAVLYAMEKLGECTHWGGNIVALCFLISCAMFGTGFFLLTHPQWLWSLLESSL